MIEENYSFPVQDLLSLNPAHLPNLGAFTIFGFSKEPEILLRHKLSERLGLTPRIIDFGNAGCFFFYAAHKDVIETDQVIAFKLGFVRSPTQSPLSIQQLVDQKIITPHHVDHNAFQGNALVACFSKVEAKLIAFKNVVSLPQLYYWKNGDSFIASDSLKCLVTFLDRIELNEAIIPFHFMFRHAPGTLTYFKHISRLFPGQIFKWQEGNLDVRRVQDLRFNSNWTFNRNYSQAVERVYQDLKTVLGAYVDDIEKSGHTLANLLSGGVDSSLLQLLLNEEVTSLPAKSFSFAPTETPSFIFEVDYARQASALLKTDHAVINFKPEDYPGLVTRAIEILGQPVLSDVEPGKLALAEFFGQQSGRTRFFFVAQGADTLFGLGAAKKLKVLELLQKIAGSRFALAGAGRLIKPFSIWGERLLNVSHVLSNDPHFFMAQPNTIAVYSNLDIARRSFGDEAIRNVLEFRRNLQTEYLNSPNYTEQVHVIDLLSDTYEIQVQSSRLFLAHNKEQVYPFMDEEIIRTSLEFNPRTRYIKGWRTKPLLKDILEQQALSEIARKKKGGSVFTKDLYTWMRSGPLSELIEEIDRPGFLSKTDFEKLLQKPDHFLWSLLTFDLFQKKILKC